MVARLIIGRDPKSLSQLLQLQHTPKIDQPSDLLPSFNFPLSPRENLSSVAAMSDTKAVRGVKRRHQAEDSRDGPLTSGGDVHPAKKKRISKEKRAAQEGTSTWARKRIRAIERTFQRAKSLPANKRNELERELAAHKATLAGRSTDQASRKKREAMISKYHMVRFFGMSSFWSSHI
jgi:hypothetical protein